MKRILIIRFSSIGDIVLTTPVIRCIKTQMPETEIHFLTKKCFAEVLQNNPYIDNLYYLESSILKTIMKVSAFNYDIIIDLHSNFRTNLIKLLANKPSYSFNKKNIYKWLLVNFKIDLLPDIHIVDRYLNTAKKIGITNDNKGLDFFTSTDVLPLEKLGIKEIGNYVAFVIGAKHNTKALSITKIIDIINEIAKSVVLIGGKDDAEKANNIIKNTSNKNVFNAVGTMSIQESALFIKNADVVITHDTGFMHIAAAFNKKIISIWGSTVPKFGMYPYMPQNKELVTIIEQKELKCRPCSKIGFKECPKKHFDCMNKINAEDIYKLANK
ncbi:MAG: glycosyl transferase [Bacteroidetes bacterium GWE2_29_8]|nr:MAG: glycosyl transferase [Bacteroidetes bacterium GWE2_29_8]